MCIGFPATYRNQCMESRVLKWGTKELEVEHRLQKVLGKVDNCGLYDDDRSESDPSIDNNYIQETPIKQKKVSLTQKMKVKKV